MIYVSFTHPLQSKDGVFVEGVWGPYKASSFSPSSRLLLIDVQDAVFPGWWINEGGQSSTGQVRPHIPYLTSRSTEGYSQLIDFIISTHPAHQELKDLAKRKNTNIHEGL